MAVSISVTDGGEIGFMLIGFTNLAISPDFNTLKRDGEYLSRTLPATTPFTEDVYYLDYQAPSGRQVTYTSGFINGDYESAPTAPKTGTLNLSSAWIHHVAKGATSNLGDLGAIELFNLEGQTTTQKRESNVLRLAAQEKPKIHIASATAKEIVCPIFIRQQDWPAMADAFEAILWSNDLFCFRDPQGELIFCTIPSQEMRINFNRTINLTLWQSDFNEAIS